MDVVRHYDCLIQHDVREMMRYGMPTFGGHCSPSVQTHLSVSDVSEQTGTVMRADGDEIGPGLGVVVPLQANGAAVMNVHVVIR